MKKSISALAVLLVAMVLLFEAAQADVIHVPGDYPTIQAAIDAAQHGDTVLVARGTYAWETNGERYPLYMKSGVRLEGEPINIKPELCDSGIFGSITIIMCNGISDAEISGFVFKKTGSIVPGDAVWCYYCSDIKISRNVIDGTYEQSANLARGIRCMNSDEILIRENHIRDVNEIGVYGKDSTLTVEGNDFRLYEPESALYSYGVLLSNIQATTTAGNAVRGNRFAGVGKAVFIGSALVDGLTRIENNLISRCGHGIDLVFDAYSPPHDLAVVGNTITECDGDGLSMFFAEASHKVVNNIVVRCGDHGMYAQHGELHPDYNDVWGNSVEYGGNVFPGPHSISKNPLFVVGPYGRKCYLSQVAAGQPLDSACVDAGDPMYVTLPEMGTTRTDWEADTHPVDMGYHHPLLPLPGKGGSASGKRIEALQAQGESGCRRNQRESKGG